MRALLVSLLLLLARSGGAAEPCGAAVPGLEPLITGPIVLALGENPHGTRELPQAVGAIACRLVAQGVPVAIAYEMPAEEQPRIDAYLASDGGIGARQALLAGPFWQSDVKDGRASVDLLALIERVRRLRRQAGDAVGFFAIELADATQQRDTNLAGGVLRLRQQRPDALLLVVAGNNHTRIDGDVAMGARLRAAGVALLSLTVDQPSGSYFNCLGGCGPHPFGGHARGRRSFAERAAIEGMFDGRLYLPAMSASPAAVANGRRF